MDASAAGLAPDHPSPLAHTRRLDGLDVPVLAASAVVVGTGAAGLCAAGRLVDFGCRDVLVVTDKINAGTSRNAGSDKQTYYKLTLSGGEPDSVREMAETLYAGGAMDGDIALAEAAGSARAFLHLCELGVPFPQNGYGEFVGYKTDHDPRRRATSVGPYTSRSMVQRLAAKVAGHGTPVLDRCRVVDVLTRDADGTRSVAGLLLLRTDAASLPPRDRFLLIRCDAVVYATGGPAGLYATSVFPHGQWGATGAALRAGVHGKNLTEWQFGLASLHPRWNVSGTYMQAIPRFVSTDENGDGEREFLTEALPDRGRLLDLEFLKGYQWPFDVRKAAGGSSLIDLLVYRETVLRGRRVFLDFRRNPGDVGLDPRELSEEARGYLDRAGALFGTPVQRLRAMNEPAYRFFLERSLDLERQALEVGVCAQHNNGGLTADAWWESNVRGFFPVGEAAGAHGVYRPGGAALNSGQVGATRAAQRIAAQLAATTPAPAGARSPHRARATAAPRAEVAGACARDAVANQDFASIARPAVDYARRLLDAGIERGARAGSDSTGEILRRVQELMSRDAGPVRSGEAVAIAAARVRGWLRDYDDTVTVNGSSRRSIDRLFLARDVLTTAYVYLSAMDDYVRHGGRSRGSVLYTDPAGALPAVEVAALPDHLPPEPATDLPAQFRFRLDDGALDDQIQEAAWAPDVSGRAGSVTTRWRRRRPLPAVDDVFENVWREHRTGGTVR